MNTRIKFGQQLGYALNVKTAAGGAKGTAGLVNSALNWLVPAAKPVAKGAVPPPLPSGAGRTMGAAAPQMTPPPLPTPAGMSRAGLERTTGTILDAAGRPVPKRAPPPVPGPPPGKVTVSPAEAAAGRAKVTVSPAEAAAGAATQKLTPREMAQMQAMNSVQRGYSMPTAQANMPVAARAMQQNSAARNAGQAMAREMAVPRGTPPAVPGPPPGKVTISPAEAAAGRPTMRISPEEVAGTGAAAMPPRTTPRDNQSDRAMTLLRSVGLRGM